MVVVLAFLQRRILGIYWLVLVIHCVFLRLGLPYVAVTKPLLVPLLLTHLLLRDNHIDRTPGKFVFYVGLLLALFGDVLLISINNTFFLSGMIIFMIVNICYAFCFLQVAGFKLHRPLLLAVTLFGLYIIGFRFYQFMRNDLGDFAAPIVVYMFMVSAMVLAAVNAASGGHFRHVGIRYFLPGAVIFLIENILLAADIFHFSGDVNIYIAVMVTYAAAQYLFARGIEKAYL
jgi:uncharacterized membrane protein YhhN